MRAGLDALSNWKVVRLGDHCAVQNGFPFQSGGFSESDGIPLIRVRSLKAQNCDVRYNGRFDSGYLVDDGDILIGMDGDFQPCWWRGGLALLNQRVCRLRNLAPELDSYYVFSALKEPLHHIEDTTHFTTVKHLSARDVSDIRILAPPLAQQRAIARVLRAVQATRGTRERELALERERKAALMEYLFGHGTRNESRRQTTIGQIPCTWDLVTLGSVSEFLQYGTSAKCEPDAIGLPVLRIPNIIGGEVEGSDLVHVVLPQDEAAKLQLRRGDILFVRTNGRREYTGRCAVYLGEPANNLFASYLIRVRLQPNTLLPEFVQLYSMTQRGRSCLSGRASNAADGKFNINIPTIAGVDVPKPTLDEQRQVVEVAQACSAKVKAIQQELALLDELFQTLLEELMTGRLSAVPLIEAT